MNTADLPPARAAELSQLCKNATATVASNASARDVFIYAIHIETAHESTNTQVVETDLTDDQRALINFVTELQT